MKATAAVIFLSLSILQTCSGQLLPTLIPSLIPSPKPVCGMNAQNTFGCCMDLIPPQGKGCVNFTYIPEELGIEIVATISGVKTFSTKISGSNMPPICFPLPQFPAVTFCGSFKNMTFINDKFTVCPRLDIVLATTTLVRIDFGCLKIGKKSFDIDFADGGIKGMKK